MIYPHQVILNLTSDLVDIRDLIANTVAIYDSSGKSRKRAVYILRPGKQEHIMVYIFPHFKFRS